MIREASVPVPVANLGSVDSAGLVAMNPAPSAVRAVGSDESPGNGLVEFLLLSP